MKVNEYTFWYFNMYFLKIWDVCVCVCVCVCTHSRMVWLFVTPWTAAHQAPLSMEFSRQEYWSGLPFPIPRDVPNPGIEPVSPVSPALEGRFSTTKPPGKPEIFLKHLRTGAFELWYWRRCLRVSWTSRRSNQSILKEISPE